MRHIIYISITISTLNDKDRKKVILWLEKNELLYIVDNSDIIVDGISIEDFDQLRNEVLLKDE